MEICLYIISTHFGTYYCGITNNLRRRWKEHIKGQSKYLSIMKAKEVVMVEFYSNYDSARRREKWIKQRGPGNVAKEYLIRNKQ